MNKKVYSLPILMLMIMMLAGIVNGATTCTIVTPATSATLQGASELINISLTGAENATYANCTVTATSSASGGSWAVGTALNSSNGAYANVTVSTTGEEDAADWAFAATCTNGSAITCTGTTGVTIDNTVPAISSCTKDGASVTNGTADDSQAAFSCTVTDATACNAYWKDTTALAFATTAAARGNLALSAFTASDTYASGETITATVYQIEDNNMDFYFDCTDGTNTTTGATYTINLDGYSMAQKTAKDALGTTTTFSNDNVKKGVLIGAVAFVVILLLIAGFTKMKK